MTVVVTFLCSDGVVVAADSMLTSNVGNIPIAHHTGRKVAILTGGQVFAFAGDHGQGDRFKFIADSSHDQIARKDHPIDYGLHISTHLVHQFHATGIADATNLNAVLAYTHQGKPTCCVFEGNIQPRLLDEDHFYCAMGSGKLSADPFVRFLVEVFCQEGKPKVREAMFLATWVIEHVIRTSPGGVAGPIRIGVLEQNDKHEFAAYEVPDQEIEEHRMAIESAAGALQLWRDKIMTGEAASETPPLDVGNPHCG